MTLTSVSPGFQWALGGAGNRYFCFTVLPFGLSSAPYTFTKIFRPVVRYWRGLIIHLVLYLDDGAGCEKDFLTTQHCSDIVRSDLVKAGLVPHCDKSIWTPVQRLEWLSISWDLLSATLSIPQPRIDRLLSLSRFKDNLPFVTPVSLPPLLPKLFLYRHVWVISPLSCLDFCSLQSPFAMPGIPLLI